MTNLKFCIFVHPVNAKFTIGQYRSTVDSQLHAGINICVQSRGATFENFRYRFYFIRQFWTAWKCNKSLVLVILYIIIFSRFDTKWWISEIKNSQKIEIYSTLSLWSIAYILGCDYSIPRYNIYTWTNLYLY